MVIVFFPNGDINALNLLLSTIKEKSPHVKCQMQLGQITNNINIPFAPLPTGLYTYC